MVRTISNLEVAKPAWSGDEAALRRLVAVAEKCLAEAWRAEAPQDLQAENKTYPATVEAKHGQLEHTGSIDEVLATDEIDIDQLTYFRVSGGGKDTKQSVELKLSTENGWHCKVMGNPQWARATLAQLDNERRRSTPWWAFLRTQLAYVVYGLVLTASAAIAVGGYIRFREEGGKPAGLGSTIVVNILIFGVVAFTAGVLTAACVRKVLPGFEVISPTRPSRGGRAVGVVGGILVSAVVGIVVNLLTQ